MPEPGSDGTIEIVRGRLDPERAEQVLGFWAELDAVRGAEAQRRLPEVVCLLRDAQGELAGVNSVFEAEVALVGGRRFWIYRRLLREDAPAMADAMLAAAFAALDEEFRPGAGGPVGLCVLLADRAEMARRPQAAWDEPPLLHAGFLEDGRQVRIGYFAGAKIGPGSDTTIVPTGELPPGYRVELHAEQDTVDDDAIVELWTREGAVDEAEARRRVAEVVLVAIGPEGDPVGVCTAYLRRNPQLGLDFWHARAYVAAAHRLSSVAWVLAQRCHEHLVEQFVSGRDTRGAGVLGEVENEGLKHYANDGVSPPLGYTFVGESPRGAHVRVHYFPGVEAPPPPAGTGGAAG